MHLYSFHGSLHYYCEHLTVAPMWQVLFGFLPLLPKVDFWSYLICYTIIHLFTNIYFIKIFWLRFAVVYYKLSDKNEDRFSFFPPIT